MYLNLGNFWHFFLLDLQSSKCTEELRQNFQFIAKRLTESLNNETRSFRRNCVSHKLIETLRYFTSASSRLQVRFGFHEKCARILHRSVKAVIAFFCRNSCNLRSASKNRCEFPNSRNTNVCTANNRSGGTDGRQIFAIASVRCGVATFPQFPLKTPKIAH